MFGNLPNWTRPRRLVQFWQNFQTSLVLLIPNCTHHRMITYTYYGFKQAIARRIRHLLPCSRRHIHFFQSLDYKKIIPKQRIHERFLKE